MKDRSDRKRARKLTLRRETVHALKADELRQVQGRYGNPSLCHCMTFFPLCHEK